MSALLIENAEGIFTGLPGEAMRAHGSIRIRDGVIMAIGMLTPESSFLLDGQADSKTSSEQSGKSTV